MRDTVTSDASIMSGWKTISKQMEDNVEVSKNLENVEELMMPDFTATVKVEEAEEEDIEIEVESPSLPIA
jgi:hypothetical protein